MALVFDIETIPKQGDSYSEFLEAEMNDFKPPSSLSKAQALSDLGVDPNSKDWKYKTKDECVAAWAEEFAATKAPEVAEAKWRKTALDGAHGEIISIAWKNEDDETLVSYRKLGDSEQDLILSFYESVLPLMNGRTPYFAGHNIAGFDLRFIYHRSVINKVFPPFKLNFAGRHGSDYFDNMIAWTGFRNERISQDNLAKALGLAGKPNDIDGSKVWDYVKEGKEAEVAEYNVDDVNQAYEIYKRLTFA